MEQQTTDEHSLRYPGWAVVFACFVMALFAWGIGFYGHSVYLAELTIERGWTTGFVGGATTAYYLVSALMVVFINDVICRFGARAVVAIGSVALAASVTILAFAVGPWHLLCAYLVMSIGWAALTIAAITNILGMWFVTRRGLAVSLALNGASVGGIVGTPLLVWLIATLGFRNAMLVTAGLTICVLLPTVLLWVRQPDYLRWRPVSETGGPTSDRQTRAAYLRSGHFWTVAAPFAIGLAAQVGFIVHQIAFLQPKLGRETAGLAIALTTITAVVGRVGLGFWIDRLDQRIVSASSLLSQSVALAIMASTDTPYVLLAASVLFGFSVGNLITLPALLIQREYPPEAFGLLTALVVAINQVTYAFGPGVLGLLRQAGGNYVLPIAFCISLQCFAAGLVLLGRRSAHRQGSSLELN